MQPDIERYCRHFATEVRANSYKDCTGNRRARNDAANAIAPLMSYLQENVITLHGWLHKVRNSNELFPR